VIRPDDIRLDLTCGACPEQYDAYVSEDGVDRQVGYLRLRHGAFRVDYPDCGGKTLFSANPKGDGAFDDDEREHYLKMARWAIAAEENGERFIDFVLDGIEGWQAAVAAGKTLAGFDEWRQSQEA
jgi:hypothetical protein